MKILLDENLSARVARMLGAEGFDIVHARDVALNRALDERILDYCRDEGRVLVTLDADFHALPALSGASQPSVVRIRIEKPPDALVVSLIRRLVRDFNEELLRGTAVTVKESTVRVHELPLFEPAGGVVSGHVNHGALDIRAYYDGTDDSAVERVTSAVSDLVREK